jgi:hypothetical protein
MHEADEKCICINHEIMKWEIGRDRNIMLRWFLKKQVMIRCTGFNRLRIWSNGRLL